MQHHKFKIASLLFAGGFWLMESLIHLLFFHAARYELLPRDPNEIWMRMVLVLLLLTCGVYVDHHMEMKRRKEQEKTDIYEAMIYSTHNILNNFLNQMQLMKMAAKRCDGFDPRALILFDEIVEEAVTLIDRLSHVSNLTREEIQAAVTLHPDLSTQPAPRDH